MPAVRRQPVGRPVINSRHPMARGLFEAWLPAISPLGAVGRSSLRATGSGNAYRTPVGLGWNCTGSARKYAISGFGGKAAAWIVIAHRSNAGGVNCSVARRGGSVTAIQEWDGNVNVAPFRSDGSFAGWTPYGNISAFQNRVNTFCGVISSKEKVIFSNGGQSINIGNVDGLAGIESGSPFTLGGNEDDGEIASPYTILGAFLWSGSEVPTSAQLREWSSNVWQMFKGTGIDDAELLLRSSGQVADTSLIGAAAAVVSAYGELSTAIPLFGVAKDATLGSGAVTTAIRMAGSATAATSANGTLTTAIALAAPNIAPGGAAASLSTSISLTASASSPSTNSAGLSIPSRGMAAVSMSPVGAATALSTEIRLSTSAVTSAGAHAVLEAGSSMSSAAYSATSAQSALSTNIDLIAASTTWSSAAAAFAVTANAIDARVTSPSASHAALTTAISLAIKAGTTSSAAADLLSSIPLVPNDNRTYRGTPRVREYAAQERVRTL